MVSRITNELGTILLDDRVISNIACQAAMESYGVVGLAARNAKDGLYDLLGIENMNKGVTVIPTDLGSVIIQIEVIMEYGIRIATVAQNLIEKITYSVEESTGIKVETVELYIQGIRF